MSFEVRLLQLKSWSDEQEKAFTCLKEQLSNDFIPKKKLNLL